MKIRYLTQPELDSLDPTGKAREKIAAMRVGSPTPVPTPLSHISREGWLTLYDKATRSVLSSPAHAAYKEWDDKHRAKYGAQGDTFSLDEVKSHYQTSYRLAERAWTAHPLLIEARDFFMDLVRFHRERVGIAQLATPVYYDTLAGLPTMDRKGNFIAETVAAKEFRHIWPSVPGQRSQRLKHRVINLSSVLDVRTLEPLLGGIRAWFKSYLPEWFPALESPSVHLDATITRHVDRGHFSIETDYAACDEHFSLDLVQTYLYPIWELLLTPSESITLFRSVEESFYQPVFFGDTLWEGKHNAFSGQVLVSDAETLFGILLAIAACIGVGISPNEVSVCAMGDDIALLTDRKGDALMDAMLEIGGSAGMEFSREKCAVRKGCVTFCRKLYYPQGKRYTDSLGRVSLCGAYPGVLTLNSVVNPERHSKTYPNLLQATFQRLDNLLGAPVFHAVTELIGARWKATPHVVDLTALHENAWKDWWYRLYGEKWSFDTSPSAQALSRVGLLRKFLTLQDANN